IAATTAPGRVGTFPCDLGDVAALDGLVGRIEDERGAVDVLVNNAGVDHTGPFDAMTAAGVNQLTAGLRAELKGSGVGTTLVEIGPVATGMMDGLREYAPTAASVRRLERAGLSPELDARVVAEAMADAITS